jgi:hypothetical protein
MRERSSFLADKAFSFELYGVFSHGFACDVKSGRVEELTRRSANGGLFIGGTFRMAFRIEQPIPVVHLLAASAANEARIHTSCPEG